MGKYIVYRLDGIAKIHVAEWLDALDDRYALEDAQAIPVPAAARFGSSTGRSAGCRSSLVAVAVQIDRRAGRFILPVGRDLLALLTGKVRLPLRLGVGGG